MWPFFFFFGLSPYNSLQSENLMKALIFQYPHDSNGLCEVNLRSVRAKIVYFEGAWVSPFMIQFTRIRHASVVLLIWNKWFIIKIIKKKSAFY